MHTATAIVCAYASLQDTLQISPFGGGGHERRAFTKSVFCTMYADRMSGGVVGQGCHRASSSTRRPPVASGFTHSGTYTVGAQERSYKVHLATKGIQIRFRHHYLTLVNFFSFSHGYVFTIFSLPTPHRVWVWWLVASSLLSRMVVQYRSAGRDREDEGF